MNSDFKTLEKVVLKARNPEKAKILQKFFRTGKGQYAEGDQMLGITVPIERQIAKDFRKLPFSDIEKALHSPFHEFRVIALFIAIHQFEAALKLKDTKAAKKIIQFYLSNTAYINNWDLVDLSAYKLLGRWLIDQDRAILYQLARSKSLWEKRIAIISTYYFLKRGQFKDTLAISEILLSDPHDLIHKAVGWMLREVGKQDLPTLNAFLAKHAPSLPRTALRYAIERHPEAIRKKYLNIKKIPAAL